MLKEFNDPILRLAPENIEYTIQCIDKYVEETGKKPRSNLDALRFQPFRYTSDNYLFSGEIEFLDELISNLSIPDRRKMSAKTTKLVNRALDRLKRYQFERANHALDQLKLCEKLYKTVERNKRKRASVMQKPSLRSIQTWRRERESEIQDSINEIDQLISSRKETVMRRSRAGRLDWRTLFIELEKEIDVVKAKTHDIGKFVTEVEKENREIYRFQLSVVAIVSAILLQPLISLYGPKFFESLTMFP